MPWIRVLPSHCDGIPTYETNYRVDRLANSTLTYNRLYRSVSSASFDAPSSFCEAVWSRVDVCWKSSSTSRIRRLKAAVSASCCRQNTERDEINTALVWQKWPHARIPQAQPSLEETYGESICLECCVVWKRNVDSTKRRRPEAFEIWIWRRMMKVPWTEHKTNEEILQMVATEREITDTVRSRQKRWLGHILRHDSLRVGEINFILLWITLEGHIQGKKAYGRPRTMLLDWLLKTGEGNNY